MIVAKYTAPRLRVNDGGTWRDVQPGEALTVDGNLEATFVEVASPPWGDDETGEWFPGMVRVRWGWGAEEEVKETSLGSRYSVKGGEE